MRPPRLRLPATSQLGARNHTLAPHLLPPRGPLRCFRAGLPPTITVCLLSGGSNNFTCPLPPDIPPACAATFCNCEAGQFFVAGGCQNCSSGYTSSRGASYCTACPRGTFAAADKKSCALCPPGSTSQPSSSALDDCTCPFGSFADYSAGAGATFECRACPPGALCDAARFPRPLAQAGYWHSLDSPTRFYVCPEGVCLAEDPTRNIYLNQSSCREGASTVQRPLSRLNDCVPACVPHRAH